MRRVTVANVKRRRGIRILVILFVCCCSLYFSMFLATGQLGAFPGFVMRVAGVTILACLLVVAVAKVRNWTESEYRNRERLFEETGSQLIIDAFGEVAFRKLYHYEQDAIFPAQAIDACREMLQSEESGMNAHLRFHLLVRLARYYGKDGQPERAIESLLGALDIDPTSLIPNCRIATLFERMGKGAEAISHYGYAMRDKDVSPRLKKAMAEQIDRIKTHGPRERNPFDGDGIQWMWGS